MRESWVRIMPGVQEGREHVPARAGAAEAREADARGAEALRDVAGDVDAHHVEGHALGPGPPQRREAVADLLEAGAEAVPEQLDVVALGLARPRGTRA